LSDPPALREPRSLLLLLPIAGALLLGEALVRPARAAILNVPATYPTVRAAINVAASGDTVLVAPGVHAGGAWVNGKRVTVASWYAVTGDTGMVAQTVIDGVAANACNGAPGCVGNALFEFGDNAHGSHLIGLTLTRGENGVTSASTVDLTRCRVVGNGDGVDYVPGAGGTFRNSLFADNSDDGVDLNGRMNVAILDCDIRDNADDGIEFRLYAYTGPTRQVDILGNRITGNGEDGVQLIDYPGVGNYVIRIERNLFQSNYDGTGLSAAIASMPDAETIESLVGAPIAERVYVTNNTFIDERNGVVGGANTIALNNIFTGIQGTALRRVGGASISAYNLFWSTGTHYVESNVDLPHLLHAAPQLDVTGRLTPPSPAVDAGTAFYQWQGQTVLSLPPTDYQGDAPDLGAFETAANTAPLVSAGPDGTVTLAHDAVETGGPDILMPGPAAGLRADVALQGTVSDDGLPYPPRPGAAWSVVSGPGPVRFTSPTQPGAQASFSVPGTYLLQLTVNDGQLAASDLVQITVELPRNLPPAVEAGPQQVVVLPALATLQGTVTDDGLPIPPGTVTHGWSKVSGPGPVTFETPALAGTRASFTTPGNYLLRLTASDGELAAGDSVVVIVQPVPNDPPVVDAGSDQSIMIPSDAILDGTATDDGRPVPPAALTLAWSVVAGPGAVTFQDPGQADTRAGFTVPGTYLLRLTAFDGALSGSDLVQILVQPPPPAIEVRVNAGSDDKEEEAGGKIVRNGSDIDLVHDGGSQTVGLRFTGVAVPAGATIIRAYIQFEADAAESGTASLLLRGQAADDPATFTNADHDVSSRPRTAASAAWSPPAWTTVGEAGAAQRTSDLKAVIQELVDRPGWASGNAMALIVTGTGTGKRTARSQESDPSGAALLHIEYGGLAVPAGAEPGDGTATATAGRETAEGDLRHAPRLDAAPETAAPAPALTPRLEFALHGVSPQPARGPLRVEFTLADPDPATLELLDVTGRRVLTRAVGARGAGRHAIELRDRLPAGVYLVRLSQGGRTRGAKAVVIP
jgi:hypothetical protein